ncbi:iron-containing alcohol dehydrogenase [Terasakiella sp.]|uniref:iron-containing alcohol dehydrogenase n=1 Tax=Terasakiella sp. TaxID=2034861 RepID=UPI003AA8E567
MTIAFAAKAVPELIFARGSFDSLPRRAAAYGTNVLLIGDAYLQNHPSLLKEVSDKLIVAGLRVDHVSARGKQTQEASRKITNAYDLEQYDCVISLGGGRAIDTGKLVAKSCPHIAVPTTAGSGAPMNGVIFGGAEAVEETFNSFLVPDLVIGDPAFIDEMDRDDFAARALTVLMLLGEAYVSPKASVLSDALVWSGLEAFVRGFVRGVEGDPQGRDDVFYASLMAGVGTGQAGFGLTHRYGAIVEQKTGLTYAQACATVCAETTDLQLQLLADLYPDHAAMDKYALIGELIAERPFEDREEAYASLVGTLRRWVARLNLSKISLKETALTGICRTIERDWDETVLPIHPDLNDLETPLLRRLL